MASGSALRGTGLAMWLLVGCAAAPSHTGADASVEVSDGGSTQGQDGGGAAGTDAGIVDTGGRYVAGCESFDKLCEQGNATNPDCGRCEYRILFNADRCTKERPCDNLVLLFASYDCMKPKIGELLDGVVSANPDFVTACVQPLSPGEILPSSLGAPQRDNTAILAAFEELKSTRGVWTGKNLLMGGCSAGGSRYPVVAARFPDDAQWVGTAKTAVCMSDGVVDLPYQDQFISEGTSPSCEGRHRRIASSYSVNIAVSGHSCSSSPAGQCACDPAHAHRSFANSCAGGDCVDFDSVVKQADAGAWTFNTGITAASFAASHWKLISEGSSFGLADRCDKDIVPEEPYQALCNLIDDDPQRSCTFESHPNDPHCSIYTTNFNSACVDWFKTL